ncbi:lipid IV(A) 3-deoxy-D-manno-octulosonic acid transferase [Vibrio hannami]|uniref:lipid IV(A) 3-deoxy-D-manno-octulosonic acid transferase n=1 Tax=Vibrio hannami TaxID=2717094 RepID=UPI0024105C29|nr:lipid IV(A) 3-deoxy-D-manno-octulosonic acid transferase [Vibrio hannami]MDG3086914.1 lipid IV(A) 3-deoxy-D-manno-octulosonic acid transferase [Vibrio hannami]
MLRLIYTALLIIISPLFLYQLLRRKEGKPSIGKRWKEYFGFTPKLNSTESPLWIHAVSVGETIAVSPVIKAIKEKNPDQTILLTTTTTTGAEQAQKLGELVEHRYMPLDFPFALKGFLKSVSPSQLLIMETELWPNTLAIVAKAGIPITVINARLSERSCNRYKKIQPVFDLLAKSLTQVLCQHKDDAERFIKLGIPKDKVQVTGSVKFDIQVSNKIKAKGEELRTTLGLKRPVWIAASTHAGEDEQVLEAHKQITSLIPGALLILVPRHPERFFGVEQLSTKFGFTTTTRSSKQSVTTNTEVYLGDTMGEMLTLMGASDVCFIGGSLVGEKVGGHNLLEPAALGKALINGPSYFNFTDIANQLRDSEALTFCSNSDELANQIIQLFNDENKRQKMGNAALDVVNNNKGAIEKTVRYVS